jgi:phospholipase/carboxylesterase
VPTLTDPAFQLNGWTYHLRPASASPVRLLLMLHGWTGNENSMGIFTRNIQAQYAILLPRAPHIAPEGGYTWREILPGTWGLPGLEELRPSAEAVMEFVDDWSAVHGVDGSNFDVAGFSQGAAMVYALALFFPRRVDRAAALSGFLPSGSEVRLAVLEGKRFFVSHGRSDEKIPVEQARRVRFLLEQAGVQVSYCETDGGHKVGKECLKGIESFFRNG